MKQFFLITIILLTANISIAQEEMVVKTPSGYQGFLEQGNSYRLADDNTYIVGFSTTHGFYFGNNTFVGIGVAFEGGEDFFAVPIFTAVKYNFSYRKNITPTIQVRVGSYISDNVGPYADFALGLRFGSKRDFAVNVMLTGSYYVNAKQHKNIYNTATSTYEDIYTPVNPSGIGIRLGIEW